MKNKKNRIEKWFALFFVCTVCLTGCGSIASESVREENGKLNVVTTLFPYYDFVRQIAGEYVNLELIIPAGMDSHSFEPTPSDIRKIEQADVMFANGGHMELWVSQVVDSLEHEDLQMVYMMDYVEVVAEEVVEGMEHNHAHSHVHADGAECTEDHDHDHFHATETEACTDDSHNHEDDTCTEEDHDHEEDACTDEDHDHENDVCTEEDHDHEEDACTEEDHDHEAEPCTDDSHAHEDESQYEIEYDEHIWTSPVNAMEIVEVIAETLMEADPRHADIYYYNKEAYLRELEDIDAQFREVRAEAVHDIMIMGDKFPLRYFAEEYDLRYRAAFSGCSSDTEPSAKTIAYLIDKMKEEELPAIYYLELSSHRVSEIIGEETGAQPLLFHSCHNVTRREFEDGVTYVQLMEQNVKNLREGICK